MYPLQRSDEVDNQIPYISCQPDKAQHDLITFQSSNLPVTNSRKGHRPQRRLSQIQDTNNNDDGTNQCKLKRIMHRDIERQRRQEMANLYASLRSLLPLEYIKGKRSISDHMHEAVNYIKYLQKNIGELRVQRDKLIRKSNLSTGILDNGSSDSCSRISSTVTVNTCRDGLEILISSSPNEEVFPLSKVLKKLLDEGFNVVSCVSTKANVTALHRILTEVSDPKRIDMLPLKQKLTNAINGESNTE